MLCVLQAFGHKPKYWTNENVDLMIRLKQQFTRKYTFSHYQLPTNGKSSEVSLSTKQFWSFTEKQHSLRQWTMETCFKTQKKKEEENGFIQLDWRNQCL